MKYSELVKKLKAAGCKYIGPGKRHDEWIGVNGKTFYVPRHKTQEVPVGTCQEILKQAGLK